MESGRDLVRRNAARKVYALPMNGTGYLLAEGVNRGCVPKS